METMYTQREVPTDDDSRRLALEWATRQYQHIEVGQGAALGDEVLALAQRYYEFLSA